MKEVSIKIRNYKCFGEEFQGFDSIYPINIIIGRNNSGKSSLLDLIKFAIKPYDLSPLSHKNQNPEVIFTVPLLEDDVKKVFVPGGRGGNISGDHWGFGQKWVGEKITLIMNHIGKREFLRLSEPIPKSLKGFQENFVRTLTSPFEGRIFKHLKAERDIHPEADGDYGEKCVDEHGQGATNIIQQFINKASLPSRLVEIIMLDELNKIMQPDATFSDIVVQQLSNKKWEIYLEESEKGRIALSESGSGLQTILLVLTFLYLVPIMESKLINRYIFAFEELENNVHPALQRRLFLYLRGIALKQKICMFITTHSSVPIDLFSNDKEAQIIHTLHDGKKATANRVEAYVQRKEILDDLDIRASDLLQSNGVVWVEGPSDRLYFNRWIEIWSKGELREGAHYQCVFYGGRLQSHLTARIGEDERNKLIKILLVNRNAIFLTDSDRQYPRERLNATKQRIRKEINDIRAIFWATKGKEIENYIPNDAVALLYEKNIDQQIGQYQPFSDYLERMIKKGEGKKFLSNKVLFAEKICQHLSRENLIPILDLEERLNEVCKHIKKWNAI